jgi:peptide chain release factor 1
MQQQKLHRERAEQRRTLLGSGDHNERIRNYNFPQNRVTDHRINLNLYKLDAIIAGNLGELIQELRDFDKKQRLGQTQGSKS